MNKTLIIFVLLCLISGTALPAKNTSTLLVEGFLFDYVEGEASRDGQRWLFRPDVELTDGRGTLKATDLIQLLPCGTLEKIEAYAEDSKEPVAIKLRGTVTRYSNRYLLRKRFRDIKLEKKYLEENLVEKNFLFPMDFLPLSAVKAEKPEAETEKEKPDTEKPSDDKPADTKPKVKRSDSIIPADIMTMLRPKRVINLTKMKKVLDIENDVMLADRTGFIVRKKNRKILTLDGLGRKVDGMSFKLLPCEGLQFAEKLDFRDTGRKRYRIAGIVTKYKGEYYMLLSRAVRTYNHGNFVK